MASLRCGFLSALSRHYPLRMTCDKAHIWTVSYQCVFVNAVSNKDRLRMICDTLKWFISSVSFQMFRQVLTFNKWLVTQVTLVWPLSSMDAHVDNQMTVPVKCSLANMTLTFLLFVHYIRILALVIHHGKNPFWVCNVIFLNSSILVTLIPASFIHTPSATSVYYNIFVCLSLLLASYANLGLHLLANYPVAFMLRCWSSYRLRLVLISVGWWPFFGNTSSTVWLNFFGLGWSFFNSYSQK